MRFRGFSAFLLICAVVPAAGAGEAVQQGLQRVRVERRDGLAFEVRPDLLGPSYFRVFEQGGEFFALARSGELLRSGDGLAPFESAGVPAGPSWPR